jgi:hypothetical protein
MCAVREIGGAMVTRVGIESRGPQERVLDPPLPGGGAHRSAPL